MATYFTADTHFFHKNIIPYCNRPFADVQEMNNVLVENWNSKIKQNDIVYHLGDFYFGSEKQLIEIRKKLNGNICICLGNHDKIRERNKPLFGFVKDIHYLKLHGEHFCLCHYAFRTWRKSGHGSINLFGHSHGALPPIGRSLDVGVDCHNYFPISFDEVMALIPSKDK